MAARNKELLSNVGIARFHRILKKGSEISVFSMADPGFLERWAASHTAQGRQNAKKGHVIYSE